MPGNANSGGRTAKSPRIHLLNGTFRKDRHGDMAPPEPEIGTPETPIALGEVAKAEWDRMVGRLEHSRTLSIVDDAALYQYCQLFAETEGVSAARSEMHALADRLTEVVGELRGDALGAAVIDVVKLRLLIAKQTGQLLQQRMAIRQYLVEFGMTPSARTRVKVTKAPEAKSRVDAFKDAKA